jgi:hypothetical protein
MKEAADIEYGPGDGLGVLGKQEGNCCGHICAIGWAPSGSAWRTRPELCVLAVNTRQADAADDAATARNDRVHADAIMKVVIRHRLSECSQPTL